MWSKAAGESLEQSYKEHCGQHHKFITKGFCTLFFLKITGLGTEDFRSNSKRFIEISVESLNSLHLIFAHGTNRDNSQA